MTTPTTLRVLNPLGVFGALLVAAAAAVLLVPLALPTGSAEAQLHDFVLQLLGTVSLLGFAFFALVSASDRVDRAPAVARQAVTCGAARAVASEPAGVVCAAA